MTDEARELPTRKAAKAALRVAGFTHGEVDALLRAGWRGLVDAREAEAAELRDQLEALRARLNSTGVEVRE